MGGGAHPVAAPGKPQSEGCREFDPRPQIPRAGETRGRLTRPSTGPGPGPRASVWGTEAAAWEAASSSPPAGVRVGWLGGCVRAACQTPPANPPAAGLAPAACRSPSSAEVCRGRELIKNMMNQENAELRAAPQPRPAPAPGPTQQGWSERAPLGAGTRGDLGSAVQATSLLALACGWHEAGDLLCGHGPSRSPGPSCGPLAALLDAAAGPWSPTVRFHR